MSFHKSIALFSDDDFDASFLERRVNRLFSVPDHCLLEDLTHLSDNTNIFWNHFSGKVVLITGASGFIGSLLIKAILFSCEKKEIPVTVLGLARDIDKAAEIYRDFSSLQCATLKLISGDITQEIALPCKIDFVLHTASPTGSGFLVSHPVETAQAIVCGTDAILRLAHENAVEGMVYLSSMEVFGTLDSDEPAGEEALGAICLHTPRSCYPEGKRMAECLCTAYSSEYGVPVRIARLAQTFGAGVLPTEKRVFAQFARSVIHNENIVLHTYGLSEGNYCYSRDAVAAILMLLFSGCSGEAYTVVNEKSHTTIRAMAEMLAHEVAGDQICVTYEIPEKPNNYGYAPDVRLRLSSAKMQGLGWRPEVSLKDSYLRMIQSIRDQEALS